MTLCTHTASSVASRSRSTSSASETFPRLETLDSVSPSTSTLALRWATATSPASSQAQCGFPSLQYDPGIGIFGMDFYVVMGRPGARVARRKRCKSRVGFSHRVKKEDTQAWFKQRVGCTLLRICGTMLTIHRLTVRGYSVGQVDGSTCILTCCPGGIIFAAISSAKVVSPQCSNCPSAAR